MHQIDEQVLEYLQKNQIKEINTLLRESDVHYLDMSLHNIGDEGVKRLARALINTPVQTLILMSANITDEGAKELIYTLSFTNILELDLSMNPIGNNTARLLCHVLKERKKFSFEYAETNIQAIGKQMIVETFGNKKEKDVLRKQALYLPFSQSKMNILVTKNQCMTVKRQKSSLCCIKFF